MTKDEALKKALEALEEAWYHVGTFQPTEKAIDLYDEARTAIKEALAQPEQEPVTWRYKIVDVFGRPAWTLKTPKSDTRVLESQPLYTTPPQRTWVGLTDEEILAVNMSTVTKLIDEPIVCDTDHNIVQLGKAIEAKLKEKNT